MVQKNAPGYARYERKATDAGDYMLTLKAGNHQVVGTSQACESASARDKGLEVFKWNAAGASMEDLTLRELKRQA